MPKGVYPRIPGKARPWQQNRQITKCLNCGIPIDDSVSCARKYCGQSCYISHHRGPNHHQYSNKSVVYKDGYRRTHGRIFEHRAVAEKALGRPLTSNEAVHHIDGNKLNNQNTNLLICSASYHQWLHNEMSIRYAREHFGAIS